MDRRRDLALIGLAFLAFTGGAQAAPAVVRFEDTSRMVAEGGTNLVVRVLRDGAVDEKTEVRWTTVNGTATAGSDFGTYFQDLAPSGVITFLPGERDKNIVVGSEPLRHFEEGWPYIRILQTPGFEPSENFSIRLSGAAVGAQSELVIEIAAHGRAVAFSNSSFIAPAGAGVVELTVDRIGDALEGVSVEYRTRDVASVTSRLYTPVSGNLTWAVDDTSQRVIKVPVLAGATPGPILAVEIDQPLNASLGDPHIAVVVRRP